MAKGWVSVRKIVLAMIIKKIVAEISENSLYKIVTLEVVDALPAFLKI